MIGHRRANFDDVLAVAEREPIVALAKKLGFALADRGDCRMRVIGGIDFAV